jgi:hypothetical protein
MKSNPLLLIVPTAALLGATFAPAKHNAAPSKVKKHPTYAVDVAPIIYEKCAGCHHEGEVAPFNLTSYADAKSKARTIAAVVEQKFMPPWQAVSHGQFVAERTLTPDQIETIKNWAATGAPSGDISKAPKTPVFTPGWQIGKPDFIGVPSKPYTVSSEGTDIYRCFVVPTHFSEGRYVQAVELRPGNRHVVHHVLVYLDTSGAARRMDGKDGQPGYTSFGGPGFPPAGALGGWAPGLQPAVAAPGSAMWLPKGADIVLQVHYHKDGKQETDLSQIGLKFADKPVDKRIRWNAIGNEVFTIPAGAHHTEVKARMKLSFPVTVFDVIPHMHLLGHDMVVTANLPDGSQKELIHVENYDFNWQTRYTYRDPVKLPAGTVLNLVAHYDNSTDNPHNPNKTPRTVTFGEQTTDEMCYAFFTYTIDSEDLIHGKAVDGDDSADATSSTLDNIFSQFDTNHDGMLDATELASIIKYFQHAASAEGGKDNTDPTAAAKLLVGMYGKTKKGYLNQAEFVKMAEAMMGGKSK